MIRRSFIASIFASLFGGCLKKSDIVGEKPFKITQIDMINSELKKLFPRCSVCENDELHGGGHPAMEHDECCKARLSFFGAPAHWGIGKPGEIRYDGDDVYQYGHTWHRLWRTEV